MLQSFFGVSSAFITTLFLVITLFSCPFSHSLNSGVCLVSFAASSFSGVLAGLGLKAAPITKRQADSGEQPALLIEMKSCKSASEVLKQVSLQS